MYDGRKVVDFVIHLTVILSVLLSSVYSKTLTFYQYLHVVTNQ